MLTLLDWHPSLAGIFSALWHIVAEIPTTSLWDILVHRSTDQKDSFLIDTCSICKYLSYCCDGVTLVWGYKLHFFWRYISWIIHHLLDLFLLHVYVYIGSSRTPKRWAKSDQFQKLFTLLWHPIDHFNDCEKMYLIFY